MSTTVSPTSGQQLWGIYYTDREHARELGDPLRTVVEAPTKQAAEEPKRRQKRRAAIVVVWRTYLMSGWLLSGNSDSCSGWFSNTPLPNRPLKVHELKVENVQLGSRRAQVE